MSIKALEKNANADVVMRDVNCDLFIIPNKGAAPYKYGLADKVIERTKEICSFNEIEYNEEDKLIQIWATNDRFENMNDHGFSIIYNGWRYNFLLDPMIPAKLFVGKKEKDIVTVTIPMRARSRYEDNDELPFSKRKACFYDEGDEIAEEDKAPEFWIDFNFRLAQQDYRYRNFGKFEDAFAYVTQ